MANGGVTARLLDMVEAIDIARSELQAIELASFEPDLRKRWLVERAIEIVSEASRHLPDDMKTRHPEVPWRKIAGVGNVLRHEYERVAPAIIWKLAREDLPALAAVCEIELASLGEA